MALFCSVLGLVVCLYVCFLSGFFVFVVRLLFLLFFVCFVSFDFFYFVLFGRLQMLCLFAYLLLPLLWDGGRISWSFTVLFDTRSA